MNIQQALLSATKKINRKQPTSAHLDAEILLSFVTNKPKTYLHSHLEKNITNAQKNKYNNLVNKRKNGSPIAYLINNRDFYSLSFYINKNVLIPRPETETLVEEVIKQARHLKQSIGKNDTITIVDIGTGSGCISVTLAKYLPYAKIIATDISQKALDVAKRNAKLHKVLNRITFKKGNLLKAVTKQTPPDIIVSNLPYLTKKELSNVPKEPKLALYGGKLGLEIIDELFIQISELEKQPIILLEIAPHQFKAIDYFAEQKLNKKISHPVKDLAGRDRIAIIK
ncbi:MAG: peptide chain release factor N(5)-glutamine methyltransferase [Candidatus Kerfeldbacteria bacterium]